VNKKEMEKQKKVLLEKKREINQQLSKFYDESKNVETGIAQDIGDKAESSYTKEFLLNLSDTERRQLLLIDKALANIANGTYGVCQRCEKQIIRKRLEAVPWALHCRECQELEDEESS
jgi:DnaK suppressor protein